MKRLLALGFLGALVLAMTSYTVSTGQADVKGKTETVLVNAKGLTLYYDTHDSPGKATCTGGCAKFWPPLLVHGSFSAPASLKAGLKVFQGANGPQLEYYGHPLYTFSGDTKPGQANGQGIAGIWYVATPELGHTSASSAPASSSGSGW
jgi:predicted lipoprotein with Yx(FWY)xxD motif